MGSAPMILSSGTSETGPRGVRDVADDADLEAVDVSERLANRERVKQCLRRVLVLAIATVDHVGVHVLRQDARRALLLAAHDDEIAVHGIERLGGIGQGLALGGRRARSREVDDVTGKALAGDLEARARARRGFEEEVDDGAAAQGGELLDRAIVDLLEAPGPYPRSRRSRLRSIRRCR